MAINHRLVRIHLLLDPMEGRPNGAWVIEYRRQAFLTDPGGGNPEPFSRSGQPSQVVESRAKVRPPLTGFDVKTREDIARQLRINPALVEFVQRSDPTFPEPIVTFNDGPIWDAEAVEGWAPTSKALPLPLPEITEPPHSGASKTSG
jgi:hypothetical protein